MRESPHHPHGPMPGILIAMADEIREWKQSFIDRVEFRSDFKSRVQPFRTWITFTLGGFDRPVEREVPGFEPSIDANSLFGLLLVLHVLPISRSVRETRVFSVWDLANR